MGRATALGIVILSISFNGMALPLEPGLSIRAGGFWASVDSSFGARVPELDRRREIDFESDLGLEESKFSPMLELTYRFNPRHALSFNYISLHRSAQSRESTKTFEIDWDDQTYLIEAGSKVGSTLDIDIYQLLYGYTLWRTERFWVSGTLGLHVMDIEAELNGELKVVNEGELDFATEIGDTVTAPLPDVGLSAVWRLTPRWQVVLLGQYFQIKFDDYMGRMTDLRLQLTYYFTDSWAASVAWEHYDLDFDHENQRRGIDLNFTYTGPVLLLQYDF
ncbi:LPS-assembly protein LptD [Ferrimonas marina]|uniref:Outer membrane protein beta-barrel domain-containing protein n=1 Tax=Ferrimonas marina TaxID=299255 RepID=A0A1M5XD45_9GAMM|nr:TonB-dependent receptor [Ferrimonas marina]SHH97424.1 hypothetical protein SAMN02745129_3428 [Ferrimonas marina]